MTIYPYNTITLALNTAVQLVSGSGGHHTYTIINLGPGALYIRQDQAPTGASDARAMKVPATLTWPVTAPIANGTSGIWVMADQAGAISVADTPR